MAYSLNVEKLQEAGRDLYISVNSYTISGGTAPPEDINNATTRIVDVSTLDSVYGKPVTGVKLVSVKGHANAYGDDRGFCYLADSQLNQYFDIGSGLIKFYCEPGIYRDSKDEANANGDLHLLWVSANQPFDDTTEAGVSLIFHFIKKYD